MGKGPKVFSFDVLLDIIEYKRAMSVSPNSGFQIAAIVLLSPEPEAGEDELRAEGAGSASAAALVRGLLHQLHDVDPGGAMQGV